MPLDCLSCSDLDHRHRQYGSSRGVGETGICARGSGWTERISGIKLAWFIQNTHRFQDNVKQRTVPFSNSIDDESSIISLD